MPCAIGQVGLGWIVNRKTHRRKVSGPFGTRGNRKIVYALVSFLLGGLVIREVKELVFLNGSADRSTLLVAVKSRRRVGFVAFELGQFVEVFIRRQRVRPKYAKNVAVKLISPGLTRHTDDACSPALVGGRHILGFHLNLIDSVLGNLHRRHDCGRFG